MNKPVVVCDDKLESCTCYLELGHKGVHQCDPRVCSGAWDYDETGDVVIHRLPVTGTLPPWSVFRDD